MLRLSGEPRRAIAVSDFGEIAHGGGGCVSHVVDSG